MGNSLVIRKSTSLTKRDRALRAAQYVRMSTDMQRYSIQNQAAAIAAYAQQNNLTIVRTYIDEGRSGLRIRNRAGLSELIDDVSAGRTDFNHILVYDVSRWGRFQDVDESAHYEFVCKQHGVKVAYCAEQFTNDGSLISNIFKNIKRVMAAEFSRELGVKVHAGQSRTVKHGYRPGGPLGYGLRRELVDEGDHSKGQLKRGQHKAIKTDRVRITQGSEAEKAVVRAIFQQFVIEKLSYAEIARRLNEERAFRREDGVWSDCKVRTILANENYAGNLIYNRTSRKLGQKQVSNPASEWIRRERVIEPIVDPNLFARARTRMSHLRVEIPEDEMLRRLRVLLHRKGELSRSIIDDAPGVPAATTLVKHFGSLRKALARIGYSVRRDCDWLDTRDRWASVVSVHAVRTVEGLKRGVSQSRDIRAIGPTVMVDNKPKITFLVARQTKKRKTNHAASWRVYRRRKLSGWLAVLQLDASNRAVAHYTIVPARAIARRYLFLSGTGVHGVPHIATMGELIKALKAHLLK